MQTALRAASEGSRVIVLRGAGPSFCSGHDLATKIESLSDGANIPARYDAIRTAVRTITLMREIPQPIVAALHGNVVGAGFAFACAADIRIAAPDTRFNAVFTKIGMSPGDLGLTWFVPRIIGMSAAAELFYRAGVLEAAEAERLGLVSRVQEDPFAEALRVAHDIAARSPFGVRQAKELLNASVGFSGFREHLEIESRTQVMCMLTDDHAEARLAYRERRDPVFTDQ